MRQKVSTLTPFGSPWRSYRYCKRKGRAFTADTAALNGNGSLHGFDQLAGDGQSQPAAAIRAMKITSQAHKALKYGFVFLGRDSPTAIGHFEAHHAFLLLFHRADHKRGMSRRVAQGISQQVTEDLFQAD